MLKNENLISGMWLLSILKSFFFFHNITSRAYIELIMREWNVYESELWTQRKEFFLSSFIWKCLHMAATDKKTTKKKLKIFMRKIRLNVHFFCDKSKALKNCTRKIHFPLNVSCINREILSVELSFFNGVKSLRITERRKWKNFLLCDSKDKSQVVDGEA